MAAFVCQVCPARPSPSAGARHTFENTRYAPVKVYVRTALARTTVFPPYGMAWRTSVTGAMNPVALAVTVAGLVATPLKVTLSVAPGRNPAPERTVVRPAAPSPIKGLSPSRAASPPVGSRKPEAASASARHPPFTGQTPPRAVSELLNTWLEDLEQPSARAGFLT